MVVLKVRCEENIPLSSLINPAPSGPDENFQDQAVLHWFLDQRLLDPGAGRERGLTTHTNIHTRLEVQTTFYLKISFV